eukprot:TRINITY_DN22735_c0_g1_i4.p1 TRINITY_DN22735_c0_g1~~TRINITY_DN22735_c0_g1_i4.p1  ORF type:complete len:752 (+),score=182.76 TRINITY_DN22735_c0_g1_i4:234-2489(+)
MGNQPGAHKSDDDFSQKGYEDFLRRTGQNPTASPKSIVTNPVAKKPDELDPFGDDDDLESFADTRSRSKSSGSKHTRTGSNPFARALPPPADPASPKRSAGAHRRTDSTSNPFALAIAPVAGAVAEDPEDPVAPADAEAAETKGGTLSPQEQEARAPEVIEAAVEALGGETLWVCTAKRGVAFRFSTDMDDKDDDKEGLDFGDIFASKGVETNESGEEFLEIALGPKATGKYYVPIMNQTADLMMKITCEDAAHGETTSIFRVDRDDGAKFCDTPTYATMAPAEGLEDNHILTSRIVMTGELGHRFALDPWRNRWVPETTMRGRRQLYALNLMKETVREVYRVVAEQGIAYRASPRFHEKLPGDDGVDRGDVLAVNALMKSMSRPHNIWFALVTNSVRWLPLTTIGGDNLLKRIDTSRSEYTFQVLEQGARVYMKPDFSEPAEDRFFFPPHKIITCCAKVAGPAGGTVDFYLLTDGKHWISNEDDLGEEQLRRVKMMAHPYLYKIIKPVEDKRVFAMPDIKGYVKHKEIQTQFKCGDVIAARLRVEANGVLFVLCAKTLTWYPTVECHGDGEMRDLLMEPTGARGTLIHVEAQKLGLKDATQSVYSNPYIQVSLVDANGQVLEDHETPFPKQAKEQHLVFNHSCTLAQPYELFEADDGYAIFFEFKHYKRDKHIVSTKCYSFVGAPEIQQHHEDFARTGFQAIPLTLEIYKCEKPTDFARKSTPTRLSVKPLFMHATVSFTSYQKKSKSKK